MRLTIVGCAGSFAGPLSPASSYLVQAPDAAGRIWSIVLDLGSGAFGALQREVDPIGVDGVLCSHMHPDHVADLTGLNVYRTYHPDIVSGIVPRRPVAVWGPPGTGERLAQFEGTAEPGADIGTLAVREVEPGAIVDIGPFRATAFAALHPVPALSWRISGPGTVPGTTVTLTYTGDTDRCAGVVEAAEQADILLAEASFVDGRDDALVGMHLTGTKAGALAREAGVRRLLLTHIPAWNDQGEAAREAGAVYSGPIDTVTQGQVFEL